MRVNIAGLHCRIGVSIFRLELLNVQCEKVTTASTVKPVLETTCIKRPPALKDQWSYTATLLKSTYLNLHLKITCCKRPLSLLPLSGLLIQVILYLCCKTVSKSCHKLQLYQFALCRWVSEICGLYNCPAHAIRLKKLTFLHYICTSFLP